jgi:hypothetical protein
MFIHRHPALRDQPRRTSRETPRKVLPAQMLVSTSPQAPSNKLVRDSANPIRWAVAGQRGGARSPYLPPAASSTAATARALAAAVSRWPLTARTMAPSTTDAAAPRPPTDPPGRRRRPAAPGTAAPRRDGPPPPMGGMLRPGSQLHGRVGDQRPAEVLDREPLRKHLPQLQQLPPAALGLSGQPALWLSLDAGASPTVRRCPAACGPSLTARACSTRPMAET